ncbi:MAG: RIP metalloprotease RseP [Alphaproteobacteria bacterium]|jgi:regulator of sigma E protease|nr:RIP metalloprotease RseP [Alphaproteobacteria bacterium]
MDLLIILKDNLLPFLAILTALVFVHEMGHYLVARWNGVRVEVFSVGFGPELFGWNDRSGTRWRFSAIPLGGYVKMFGDADASSATGDGLDRMSDDERAVSFHHKRLGQRSAVVAAGPAANFIFAIILLAGLYTLVGQRHAPPLVSAVTANSAAAIGGIQADDRIVQIGETEITAFDQLRRIVMQSPGIPLEFVIERDRRLITLVITPQAVQAENPVGSIASFGRLGVTGVPGEMVKHGLLTSIGMAATETWSMTLQTLEAVGEMFVGKRGTDELGGPLRIAQLSGTVAEAGWVTAIWFTALLSINLGLINLFPIPVLDGGHLVFYLAEAILGRPLSERIQEWAFKIGFTLVIGLMLFVTWNDIVQLKVIEFFGSLFS